MPLIVWEEEMSVGVDVFDKEHQGLMDIINRIYESATNGKGKSTIEPLMDDLAVQTKAHFNHEEEVFAQIKYPDAKAHKKEHDDLYDQLLDIQAKYKANGKDVLSLETMIFLKNWLLSHILDADKKFTNYMHEVGIF